MKTELILITGGSCSGKTFFSNSLKKTLKNTNVISMDDYYYPKYHFKDQNNINWDLPESFELDKLKNDILKLLEGKSIKKNVFIYGENIYSEKREKLKPKNFLILEGIFSFYISDVYNLANYKFFLSSKREIRYVRRKERDMRLEREFTIERFDKYWNGIMKEYEDKHLETFKSQGIVIDTNNLKNEKNILETLNSYIKRA